MAAKLSRAIDTYRTGDMKNAVIWDKSASRTHQLGELQAARKSYERPVQNGIKNTRDAINNIGTVYYAEKKYRTAITIGFIASSARSPPIRCLGASGETRMCIDDGGADSFGVIDRASC